MSENEVIVTPADKAVSESIELINKHITEMKGNQQYDSVFRFQYMLWKILDERMKSV